MVVIATLLAAVCFAAFHVPVPQRRGGRWALVRLEGPVTRLLGVGYHLLLLPAVAALPAPAWATAAGFAWMLLDVVLDGAELAGSTIDARPLRDGVHLLACVWLVCAGWTAGPVPGVIGTALALAFLARFGLDATRRPVPPRLLTVNALLNVAWMLAIAAVLG
ncbi:MAG: hypothetical protein QM779_01705 [Propionicimonas sp.]|uniref:hypothetical protein n=1 Tax=Propionicimonas sp. TaxID=1955623 RepID=UPI003D0E1D70